MAGATVSAGSVREADDGLGRLAGPGRLSRGRSPARDALAGHRAELPPAGRPAPGPSRWQAACAAGGLRLRCLHGCAGWPAELHLTLTPAGRRARLRRTNFQFTLLRHRRH